MILREGRYKLRSHKVWLAAMVRVEHSKDEDGRVADRPRLVLWVGGERHQRPLYEDWGHRLFPISPEEFDRLSCVHTPLTVSPKFDLKTAPSLF